MAEAAEVADEFDTEFEEAREAEDADEAEVEADGEEGDDEGDKPAPIDDKLAKQVQDTSRALKAERRASRDLKESNRQLLERLERLEQAPPRVAAQAAPEAMPDPNSDPIGALEWLTKQQQQASETQAQAAARQKEADQQQRQTTTMLTRMGEFEADFREDHKDYDDAAKHLKANRAEELQEAGYEGAELNQALARDMFAIVQRAMAANKDPAEVVYNLAKKRGFGVDKVATTLQTISKGQGSTRSMTSSGRPGGILPVSEGNKLKGAAYDKWFEAVRKRERA